jgi:GEVED domain-containing protein
VRVYIDANNNGTRELDETSTLTNQFGAYAFTNVAPGQQVVRIEVSSPIVQTAPVLGQPWVVNLTGSSTISTLHFGIVDLAVNDYGDLPASYELRPLAGGGFVADPAFHKKSQYWLGSSVDGELGGVASPNADSDDLGGEGDDEDGITVTSGSGIVQITATAQTYTGYLQAWFDWNEDGDFLDANERVITDALLVAGQNTLFVTVPQGVTATQVYARFRYGEHSHNPQTGQPRAIDTPWGAAATGEVEDYRISVPPPAGPILAFFPADFDRDEDVDGTDFLAWQRGVGKTTGAQKSDGNADFDEDVDGNDLVRWMSGFGAQAGGSASSTANGTGAGAIAVAPTGSGNAFNPWGGSSIATGLGSQLGGVAESLLAASRPIVISQTGGNGESEASATAVQTVAQKIVASSYDSVRRDEALDDLFGLASGETGSDELELELSEADCDEAFAAFAE